MFLIIFIMMHNKTNNEHWAIDDTQEYMQDNERKIT